MDSHRQRFCLLLHAQPGLGLRTADQVLSHFDSAESFWAAPASSLSMATTAAARTALLELWRSSDKGTAWQQALVWQQQMQQQAISLLEPADTDYPALLHDVPDRPGALYFRGDPTVLVLPQLAVVGSRNAGRASLALAEEFAHDLAAAGLSICSGLALGIDGAAHRGALRGSGRTVAVVGTGVDRVYPHRHRGLADEILPRGALLSEFPLGSAPLPGHFPRRNRIIAGMSLGTLVVEAAARSGSLITARLALDYNREVFAIPGSIHDPGHKGGHQLIRQGAKLVETTAHIIEELGSWLQLLAAELQPTTAPPDGRPGLSPQLTGVLKAIDYGPTPLDTIIARSGIPGARLSGLLLELELGQWVECSAGTYQRCR